LFTKPRPKSDLDRSITAAINELNNSEIGSEKYVTILDQIVKLREMKEAEKPSRVKPDTWALIGANIAGIILILNYENAHVITSKAMNLVQTPR
jgi:hypothetical protein